MNNMARLLFIVLLGGGLCLVPVPATSVMESLDNAVLYPGILDPMADPPAFFAAAAADPGLILLRAAIFDPLRHAPPDFEVYLTLTEKAAPEGFGYFIVQFDERVDARARARLRQAGARIVQYVPNNALLVGVDVAVAISLRDISGVRWVGEYRPLFRLDPELALTLSDAEKFGGDEPVQVVVECFSAMELARLRDDIRRRYPAEPQLRVLPGNDEAVIFEIPARLARDLIQHVMNISFVKWVERRPADVLFNDESSWVCQSGDSVSRRTTVFDQGLLGQGQVIAVADSGLDKDHCAFIDPEQPVVASQFVVAPAPLVIDDLQRKVIAYNVLDYLGGMDGDQTDGHGSHVSGSVAGDNFQTPAAPGDPGRDPGDGMAPLARLIMIDGGRPGDRSVYFPYPYDPLWEQEYASGAHIATNSWGSTGNSYNLGASRTDQFVYQNPDFLIFVSAGNAGPVPESLGFLSQAKNLITVGATANGLFGADSIAVFSSKGPAYDGRIKPDLAAPGVDIRSVRGNVLPETCETVLMSGTSMASPTAAGLAALVRQYYTEGWYPSGAPDPARGLVPSAALLKATLINSTRNISGGNTGYTGREDAPAAGQGWGRITLDDALYFAAKADSRKLLVWDLPNSQGVSTGGTREFPVNVTDGQPIKATLTWTDPPAVPGAAVALVNDLDLELEAADGTVYRGNQWNGQTVNGLKESQPNPAGMDNLNNVEGILVKAPAAGDYILRVKGANVPGYDQDTAQGFALVLTGGVAVRDTALVNIRSVTFSDAPGNNDGVIDPGETIELFLELENTGLASAGQVSAVLGSAGGLVTIDSAVQSYGSLEGLNSRTHTEPFIFSVDPAAANSARLTFTLDIQTETSGNFARSFELKVRPGIPPAMANLLIGETGVHVFNGFPYPTYVNISLQFDYEDPDDDLAKVVLFARVNGRNVNHYPIELNAAGLGSSGTAVQTFFPLWGWVATNVGESLQLFGYLEDLTGRRSAVTESNVITFTAGTTPVSPTGLEDDDSFRYPFPAGFSFPFYGVEYTDCWLNTDGNISFEAGYENADRTPTAFLQGMPRIAGLYTDLARFAGQTNITIQAQADRIIFRWTNIPQWSQTAPTGSHTFAITLFSDGAVELSWQGCTLTESQTDEFGRPWKGVVGLSPGSVANFGSTDLSEWNSPVPIPPDQPIYQGFTGAEDFDLAFRTLRFEPATPSPGESLYFPRLSFIPGVATEGYGFVNPGTAEAQVSFTAFANNGESVALSGPYPWPAGQQGAFQADGILDLTEETQAWVRADSDVNGLLGFFLSQYFPAGFLAGLDGAAVGSSVTTDGIFPRVKTDEAYRTEIFLANPGPRRAQVMVTAFDGVDAFDGGLLVIEPFGYVQIGLTTLLGDEEPFDGYLRLMSTEGIVGNVVIRFGEVSLSSVNLLPVAEAASKLYASHITVVPGFYYTEVNIIHVSTSDPDAELTVTLTPYDDQGQLLSAPFDVVIPPHQLVTLRDTELGLPAGMPTDGWLAVESAGGTIMGCLTFGHPVDNHYESTLPLQAAGSAELYFAQVANGNVGGVDYFTGLAVINADNAPVDVTISVHASDGTVYGSVTRTLQPGEKYVRLLQSIEGIGELPDQSSGFLRVTASGPVFAFELFGDSAGNFLSAVPAQF
ncbi:MAG: S8 family serine peptidase [Acidobacteria bacterium]|nr:S8 family serine peptidase [Acidobacteriota bacterium]